MVLPKLLITCHVQMNHWSSMRWTIKFRWNVRKGFTLWPFDVSFLRLNSPTLWYSILQICTFAFPFNILLLNCTLKCKKIHTFKSLSAWYYQNYFLVGMSLFEICLNDPFNNFLSWGLNFGIHGFLWKPPELSMFIIFILEPIQKSYNLYFITICEYEYAILSWKQFFLLRCIQNEKKKTSCQLLWACWLFLLFMWFYWCFCYHYAVACYVANKEGSWNFVSFLGMCDCDAEIFCYVWVNQCLHKGERYFVVI